MSADPQEQARIAEEASLWLERIERTITREEASALRKWLKPKLHRELIVDRCKRWHGPEILSVLAELVPVEHLTDRVERHYGKVLLFICLAVSGIALATVVIAVSKIRPRWDAQGNPMRAEVSAATAVGERKKLELPDRGWILLNTATQLEVQFEPRSRDVLLQRGEIMIEATSSSSRSFRVLAGVRTLVIADGVARFGVRRVDDGTLELTVLAGRVTASAGSREANMPAALLRERVTYGEESFHAGQAARLGSGWQRVWSAPPDEIARRTAWQAGVVVFDNEPLEDALLELQRYVRVRFVCADDRVRHLRISGTFDAGDVGAVRRYLRDRLAIESHTDAKESVILMPLDRDRPRRDLRIDDERPRNETVAVLPRLLPG